MMSASDTLQPTNMELLMEYKSTSNHLNAGPDTQKNANVCLKRRRSTTPQVSIDGVSIDQTTKAKYLVLIVDSRLAFGDHITNTVAIYNANRASCFDCSI